MLGPKEPAQEPIWVPHLQIPEQIEALMTHVLQVRKNRSTDLAPAFATRQEAHLVLLVKKKFKGDPYPDLAKLLRYAHDYVGSRLHAAGRPVARNPSRRSFAPSALRRRVERLRTAPGRLDANLKTWVEETFERVTRKPAA